MFKRKIYDKMLNWKNTFNGQTALLIKGARRVGKSTIAAEFAKKEYQSYILVDFSSASPTVKELFEDLSDLNYIFLQLQLLYRTTLYERNSVIIFDEVQLCPAARQAIKHLVKDHRYDYIETGSLLSIKKNIQNIVIPSEETRITMYPLDYEEFRWALGDETTVSLMKCAFEAQKPLGAAVHRQLLRDFRLYMLIGGMPQAVNAYLTTNNFEAIDQIKRNILELYEDDFRKIDPTGRASLLFDAIPAELSKNTARYKANNILSAPKTNAVEELVGDMKDSLTVLPAYHANDPSAGMALQKNLDNYKLFLSDTGLFTTLAFKDKDFTENIIYEMLLNDKLNTNLGYLYENIVAQTLQTKGYQLYYYTFPTENSNHKYEVDFLLAKGNKLCPLEIKSSGYKTHASLDAFSKKYSSKIGFKYLIYTKDLHKEDDVLYLPVYMTQFL